MEEIGIDIINISFVKKMIKKHGNSFAKKILSEEEFIEFSIKKRRKFEFLAGRFAAKEAFFKATNLQFEYKDISILNNERGKPYLVLKEQYKKYENCKISISHHIDYATAVVFWMGCENYL